MAMGTRKDRERQEMLWLSSTEIRATAAHPFYQRLNELLDEHGFGRFVEGECKQFYADKMGRPSLSPGMYFRLLLVGYFEGIDSEPGIAWRAADSLSLRRFLTIGLDEIVPDHSTISRTRRLIALEAHQKVFTWLLRLVAQEGLLKGNTIEIDATTLEANAALRSTRAMKGKLSFALATDQLLVAITLAPAAATALALPASQMLKRRSGFPKMCNARKCSAFRL